MKNYLSLIIVCLLFFSCSKTTTTTKLITYRLEGLSDIDLVDNSSSSFVLTFNQQGNIAETIALSFTGLPSGVTIDTDYAKSGKPDFSSFVTFRNDGTTVSGTYPITLHCVGTRSGERTFSFQLHVTESPITPTDCNQEVLGIWSSCITKFSSPYPYSTGFIAFISLDTSLGTKRILISPGYYNNPGNQYPIYGTLDCNSNTIFIPKQNGVPTKAQGYFSKDSIDYYLNNYGDSIHVILRR